MVAAQTDGAFVLVAAASPCARTAPGDAAVHSVLERLPIQTIEHRAQIIDLALRRHRRGFGVVDDLVGLGRDVTIDDAAGFMVVRVEQARHRDHDFRRGMAKDAVRAHQITHARSLALSIEWRFECKIKATLLPVCKRNS